MTYYKVVKVDILVDGTSVYSSICQHSNFTEKYRVFYEKDKKSIPILENSLLFVFENKYCAIEFLNWNSFHNAELWECEVESVVEVDVLVNLHASKIEDFWTKEPKSWCYKRSAPEGTVGCKSVTLKRKVEWL